MEEFLVIEKKEPLNGSPFWLYKISQNSIYNTRCYWIQIKLDLEIGASHKMDLNKFDVVEKTTKAGHNVSVLKYKG